MIEHDKVNTICCYGPFGSHLYGLNTPDSDMDYKGIYIPHQKDLYLNRVPNVIKTSTGDAHGKNTSEDIDVDLHSLTAFVKDACKGETYALDMLHMEGAEAEDMAGEIWLQLKNNRTKFYSKNMKSLIGYARKQAAKYGIKGSRVEFLEQCLSYLSEFDSEKHLTVCWEHLPEGEFANTYIEKSPNGLRWWEVCGKKFSDTTPLYLVVDSLQKMYDGYGHRAQQAKENKGVDWKAVSHALRACYQMRAIFKYGDFEYPLIENRLLLQTKQGKLDFLTEVQPELEDAIAEVERLSETSNLPEHADVDFWEDWVYRTLKVYYEHGAVARRD